MHVLLEIWKADDYTTHWDLFTKESNDHFNMCKNLSMKSIIGAKSLFNYRLEIVYLWKLLYIEHDEKARYLKTFKLDNLPR